mgnify:CR=1 FL=1
MTKKRVAPFLITADQEKWLLKRKDESGDSLASILRGLIQQQMNKAEAK